MPSNKLLALVIATFAACLPASAFAQANSNKVQSAAPPMFSELSNWLKKSGLSETSGRIGIIGGRKWISDPGKGSIDDEGPIIVVQKDQIGPIMEEGMYCQSVLAHLPNCQIVVLLVEPKDLVSDEGRMAFEEDFERFLTHSPVIAMIDPSLAQLPDFAKSVPALWQNNCLPMSITESPKTAPNGIAHYLLTESAQHQHGLFLDRNLLDGERPVKHPAAVYLSIIAIAMTHKKTLPVIERIARLSACCEVGSIQETDRRWKLGVLFEPEKEHVSFLGNMYSWDMRVRDVGSHNLYRNPSENSACRIAVTFSSSVRVRWTIVVMALLNGRAELFVPTRKGGSLVVGSSGECTKSLLKTIRSLSVQSDAVFPTVHFEETKKVFP